MPKTRKCAYCGKVFTTNSGIQKYCSEECAEQAKESRKRKQKDFFRAVEPVMELQQQEYLTFSKAAILLGCTRQYVYKLVEQGKLPASPNPKTARAAPKPVTLRTAACNTAPKLHTMIAME